MPCQFLCMFDYQQGMYTYVYFNCDIREGFGPIGPIEQHSAELLRAAMEGRVNDVSDLLINDLVHVDVADLSGHTALLGAAVRQKLSLVMLLDHNRVGCMSPGDICRTRIS